MGQLTPADAAGLVPRQIAAANALATWHMTALQGARRHQIAGRQRVGNLAQDGTPRQPAGVDVAGARSPV